MSGPEPVDPWEVLRAIRALPWLSETEVPDDEEYYVSGADAVDELHKIRLMVDEALRGPEGAQR